MNNQNELLKATVTSIAQATPKIKIFRLDFGEQPFAFKPGQWVDLYAPVEGKNIAGYTIISSIYEKGFIDLAIRESSHHPVTNYMHTEVRVGDTVTITEGQGKFFLSEELRKSSLTFIAGGIGVTPILSMFRSVDKSLTPVKIFYSVSSYEDIVLKDELAPYAVFTATKNHSDNWKGETTRINLKLLKKYNIDFGSHFFICGPRPMIDSIVSELKDYGVTADRIHFEKWW